MTSKMQILGRFLSRMVMPNIGAFITWGIITTLFHENGWFPNPSLSELIDPMIIYLLPLLIAYSGGHAVSGTRGGVIGAVGTMGLIVSTEVPMFMGAMLMGPVGGLCIDRVDKWAKSRIPIGFEMLSANFSAGILGALLLAFAYKTAGPIIQGANYILGNGVQAVIKQELLFLSAIFIEPGKILFLNNIINHGILSPFGIQDAQHTGSSIFFLLETNPGPGLGVLLAYLLYGNGSVKQTAPSALIIHFFGGIHEIYFPYVLMNPMLFLAVILGGMAGSLVFDFFGTGLVATPSPGSILALIALAPKNNVLGIVVGVAFSAMVSFGISGIILKRKKNWYETDEEMNISIFKDYLGDYKVSKIYFVCDAGMGSSAMGASLLSKILKKHSIQIPIENIAVDDIPKDADLVITYHEFLKRAKKQAPFALHVGIRDFLDKDQYEKIVREIIERLSFKEEAMELAIPSKILTVDNIVLKQPSVSKAEAIERAGKMLMNSGYVTEAYIRGMHAREEKFSTYIGNGVAIPHGENEVKDQIKASGIVVLQYPDGVDFGDGKIAKLVIGIAGKGNEHIQLLANIAEAIEDEDILRQMQETSEINYIYELFSSEEMTLL